MPVADPVTSATLPRRSITGPGPAEARKPGRSQAEHSLGVHVKDLLHDVGGQAQLVPLAQQSSIRKTRIVAAEHDLVLQPTAGVALEALRKIFWRPARELPEDVALVKRDGRHVVHPRPAGMRRDDR